MRIISFGDLQIDYYLSNDLLLGICGGKSNANILANLSKYYDTAFFGVVGNDTQGQIAINSLNDLGVDTSNIKKVNGRTKQLFITSAYASSTCPYCGRKLSSNELNYNTTDIIPLINDDDYIVVDNLNHKTEEILKSVQNPAFLNINYLGDLLYLSLDEFVELLNSRFVIINMNEKVYDKLRSKFSLDLVDFYELLNPKILIITKKDKGSLIVHNSEIYEKVITGPISEVEKSGSNDAFFAEFIRTLIDSDFLVDEKVISLSHMRASSISCFCAANYGARTHLLPLTKIKSYEECICNEITCD